MHFQVWLGRRREARPWSTLLGSLVLPFLEGCLAKKAEQAASVAMALFGGCRAVAWEAGMGGERVQAARETCTNKGGPACPEGFAPYLPTCIRGFPSSTSKMQVKQSSIKPSQQKKSHRQQPDQQRCDRVGSAEPRGSWREPGLWAFLPFKGPPGPSEGWLN